MRNIGSLIAAMAVAAGLSVFAPSHAQTAGAAGNTAGNTGNAGMQIANAGASGTGACASCHGARGEGNAAANFPRIAGQPQAYLVRQLESYANGNRRNPVMEPIAKALDRQQIDAVSSYYASMSAPASKPAQQPAASVLARGRTLATVGDNGEGVQNCANCHGPGGSGLSPYPYLASQHSGYLVAALGEWRSGTRKTDPSQQMPMIARRLADADIAAVAAYYAVQPAPVPAALRTNVPVGSASRPARQDASPGPSAVPPASSQGAQGVGVEQGTPTVGGGQGPGGGGTGSEGAPPDRGKGAK
jgi:cytochrome c553